MDFSATKSICEHDLFQLMTIFGEKKKANKDFSDSQTPKF